MSKIIQNSMELLNLEFSSKFFCGIIKVLEYFNSSPNFVAIMNVVVSGIMIHQLL
jgi:hypothetical protein